MTRLMLVPLAGLLLAGCAIFPGGRPDRAPNGPDAAWLRGSWLAIIPGGDEYPLACQSDAPLLLDGDGRYATHGEQGRWTLRGDRLSFASESERTTVTVERLSADRMRHRHADGETLLFRRCPVVR